MNFDQLVERLLETVLRLFRDVWYAGYAFVTNPDRLADSISSASVNTPGPLTFFIFPLIMFVVELLLIQAMSRGTTIRVQISPSPEAWSKGLFKFDPKEILKVAAPFVLIVAAHAAFVKASLDISGPNVSYEAVFSAGAYIGGTVFLVFAAFGAGFIVALPPFLPSLRRNADSRVRPRQSMPVWIWFVSVPPWLVFLKSAHSYFQLLAALTEASTLRTIGSWFGGTVGFVLATLALFTWFSPAIFPDVNQTNDRSPEMSVQPDIEVNAVPETIRAELSTRTKSKVETPN